ncbi:MAG: BamA/TamA family outer membrane protein, partial [Aureliella sp.]
MKITTEHRFDRARALPAPPGGRERRRLEACALVFLVVLALVCANSGCRVANWSRPPCGIAAPHSSCYKPELPALPSENSASTSTSASTDTAADASADTPAGAARFDRSLEISAAAPASDDSLRVRGQSPSPWQTPSPAGAAVNRYTQTPPATPAGGAINSYAQPGQVPGTEPPPYIPPAQQPYAQQPYAQQPYAQQPNYGQPGLAQPNYGQPTYNQFGAGGQAPFVTTQSSGVQYNQPPAGVLPAPAGQQLYNPQPYSQQLYGQQPGAQQPGTQQLYGQPLGGQAAPPVGYGAPGTYMPDTISAYQVAPGVTGSIDPQGGMPAALAPGAVPATIDPSAGFTTPTPYQPRIREAPIDIYVQEARTGRVVLGGSVNSDLGVAGQVIIDERNFDWRRLPTSWSDLFGGRAFRGAGQNFRAELMPGSNVQRYTVNFTQPHLFGWSPVSFSVGGFLFSRQFRDWTEQRLGGRLALGYDITRDLSATTELRMEDVKIYNPRLSGIPELDRVLGSNDLYTARFRLAHDTRDSPFMATEGHLIELIYDQVFGEFDYPRGQINYSRYFLVRERADGGGRHTLASTWRAGITGADTPL